MGDPACYPRRRGLCPSDSAWDKRRAFHTRALACRVLRVCTEFAVYRTPVGPVRERKRSASDFVLSDGARQHHFRGLVWGGSGGSLTAAPAPAENALTVLGDRKQRVNDTRSDAAMCKRHRRRAVNGRNIELSEQPRPIRVRYVANAVRGKTFNATHRRQSTPRDHLGRVFVMAAETMANGQPKSDAVHGGCGRPMRSSVAQVRRSGVLDPRPPGVRGRLNTQRNRRTKTRRLSK